MAKHCPACQQKLAEIDSLPQASQFSLNANCGLSLEFPTAKRIPWRAFFGILLLIGIWQTIASYVCTNLLHLNAAVTDNIKQLIAGAFFFFGCCGAYQRNLAEKRTAQSQHCPECGAVLNDK